MYNTQRQLYAYAQEFRRLAETAWSAETSFFNEYDPHNPSKGQCGVSSIGLGRWLHQEKGLDLRPMLYERGFLLHALGTVAGHNHSWLRVYHEGRDWRLDVTPDQYNGVDPGLLIVQSVNDAVLGSFHHFAEKADSLELYDPSKLAGRLAIFAERIGVTIGE